MRWEILGPIAFAVACGSGGQARDPDPVTADRCAQPPHDARGFRDTIANRLGSPRHVAADVIVAAGDTATVSGKFQYGRLGKDLEEESVALYLGDTDCGPWTEIGESDTDDDGRVAFELPAFDAPRVAPLRFVVRGDGTSANARVFAIAPGTRAVLFDIDGTLTQDDAEIVEDLLGDQADRRPGSDKVAQHWAARGHLIVYITGRPYNLRANTARWLTANRFPDGPLFTTDRWRDSLPSSSRVGTFKRTVIETLRTTGVTFEAAYGNASTDVCAYAQAGLPPEHTWIIGDDPTPTCEGHSPAHGFTSYADHLRTLPE